MGVAMNHELSPIPTSLFDEYGSMLISKSKSTLKNKLQITVKTPEDIETDVVVIDGCALLWVIPWPSCGTIEDYVKNVVKHVCRLFKTCETHVIFDRYSIKA